jgi:hypothetical protein
MLKKSFMKLLPSQSRIEASGQVSPVVNFIKSFFFVTDARGKKARVFVLAPRDLAE